MHDAFISYSRPTARSSSSGSRGARGRGQGRLGRPRRHPAGEPLGGGAAGRGPRARRSIYVISPGAIASDHCRSELEHAAERNKRLIPVAHLAVATRPTPGGGCSRNWIPQDGIRRRLRRSMGELIAAIDVDPDACARTPVGSNEPRSGPSASGAQPVGARLRAPRRRGMDDGADRPRAAAHRLQADFVAASRRGASRRQRLALGSALAALALTAAFGVYAFIQRDEAIDQRDLARSNELALSSLTVGASDPELALILALEAVETGRTERSERALAGAVNGSRVRVRVDLDDAPYIARQSADGRWLATGTDSGASLFDATTGRLCASSGARAPSTTSSSPPTRSLCSPPAATGSSGGGRSPRGGSRTRSRPPGRSRRSQSARATGSSLPPQSRVQCSRSTRAANRSESSAGTGARWSRWTSPLAARP